MKAILKFFSFSILIVIILSSCQKVIDIDVDDADENYVIEAVYNASAERVEVKITKTISVFGPVQFPTVSGAVIEIEDEEGNSEIVPESNESGIYVLENYSPKFNSDYKISIVVEGNLFEATTFLPEVVELESLSQVFEEASLFGRAGYIVFMNFQDPPGPNFYRAVRYFNGEQLTRLSQQFLFDDSFSEGNFQTVPFFSSRYDPEDTISVEFRSYSEASFKYYSEMFALAGDGGQSAAPANPVSNWSNDALGHFAAWGADTKTIIIEEE